jgi:hypothetical protein
MIEGDLGVGVMSATAQEAFVGFVPSTKKILWTTPRSKDSRTNEPVAELRSGRAYLSHATGEQTTALECVDTRTGRRLWLAPFNAGIINSVDVVSFGADRLDAAARPVPLIRARKSPKSDRAILAVSLERG